MKKIIFFIIFIGILLGGYWYFENKNNTHNRRCDEGYRFNPSTNACVAVVEQKKDEINFSTIKIKTISGKEILLSQNLNSTIYTGYSQDGSGATDKESISLDTKQIKDFDETFVIIPYVYNSGGTGQFIYMGLFNKKTNTHVDSIALGDRIVIDSIDIFNEKIKINFKDRLITESFAEAPSIPTQFVFEIKDEKIVPIMQLQNADYSDVEIKTPLPGEDITSDTVIIKGAIPGNWYFEAHANFKMVDTTYKEIGFGNIQALSDWMTTQKVPFEISVSKQNLNYSGDSTLIISSDNPADDEKNIKKIFLPLRIK